MEWPIMRTAVIIFSVAVLVSTGMIGASLYFKQQVQLEFNKNKAIFQSISQRYLAVDQEENMIHEYYPQYVELLEQGIIGREQRLNWIEVLRSYGEETSLPMLNYKISTQNPYDFEYPLELGNFRIYSSNMTIDLKLLHEGDLLNLLDTIEKNSLGLNRVNSCELQRSQKQVLYEATKANIEASCEINWFTIKRADGKDLTS